MIMELTGRIETSNSEEWKEKIVAGMPAEGDYELECGTLTYISSAGVRVCQISGYIVTAARQIRSLR